MGDRDTIFPRPMQRVGMREFRGNFSSFMRLVRQGSSFAVTSRDEVVALIQPPDPPALPQRKPGALRGKIQMSADFDTLPTHILNAMEGDGA